MSKNFEYNPALVQEARSEIANVTTTLTSYNSNSSSNKVNGLINRLSSRMQGKCGGVSFAKMNAFSNISTNITTLTNIIDESEQKIIKSLITNGDFKDMLNEWISNGSISSEQIVLMGEVYYNTMLELYGYSYVNYLKPTFYPYEVLINAGLSEEEVANIGNSFITSVVDKNLMYTRDGIAYSHKTFTGLLAMFGFKLGYEAVSPNYYSYDQFFLGDKEHQLNGTVCTSYAQFLYRCVGIDATSTLAGYTPADLWALYGATGNANGTYNSNRIMPNADGTYSSEYTSGNTGDILFNGSHIMTVLYNTGEGYVVAENGGKCNGAGTSYYTYDGIASLEYSISDMTAVFNNTSVIYTQPELHDLYIATVPKEGRYGANLYITPDVYKKNTGISSETLEKMTEQFNTRNKNGVVEPVVTPSKPVETPSKPVETPSKPVETPSKPVVTPSEPVNILPENKFSSVLPEITSGDLGPMEISTNFVSYEINNITEDAYNNYKLLLEENGFIYTDGVWKKDGYDVLSELQDGTLKLQVNITNNNE